MIDRSIHPNTRVLLDAWQRMSANPTEHAAYGPRAHDHPALLGSLFVLQCEQPDTWTFRTVGDTLTTLLGRDVTDHSFLNLWTGPDRGMTESFIQSVQADGTPGLIRGRGETLTGQRVEVEISLAPLANTEQPDAPPRLLGLYQTLGGEPLLQGRPIWRHRISTLTPPGGQMDAPKLTLVVSND